MFLFDSNVLIELGRPRARRDMLARFSAVAWGAGTTSSLVLMELRRGTALDPNPETAWRILETGLLQRLKVLDFTTREALATADINAALERRGRTLPEIDLMIGATALNHGLTMVTRNVKDFADIPGLKIENWFE